MALRRNSDGQAANPHQVYVTEAQGIANDLYKQRQREKLDRLDDRQLRRSLRTPAQQLVHLDELLGEGVGAKKERARLATQMNEEVPE